MLNENMYALGSKRSTIREIFEYAKTRSAKIGRENVFDFSIGNPSVPAPAKVNEEIRRLTSEMDSVQLHGYTSAQGDKGVRDAIAENYVRRFGVALCGEYDGAIQGSTSLYGESRGNGRLTCDTLRFACRHRQGSPHRCSH